MVFTEIVKVPVDFVQLIEVGLPLDVLFSLFHHSEPMFVILAVVDAVDVLLL